MGGENTQGIASGAFFSARFIRRMALESITGNLRKNKRRTGARFSRDGLALSGIFRFLRKRRFARSGCSSLPFCLQIRHIFDIITSIVRVFSRGVSTCGSLFYRLFFCVKRRPAGGFAMRFLRGFFICMRRSGDSGLAALPRRRVFTLVLCAGPDCLLGNTVKAG